MSKDLRTNWCGQDALGNPIKKGMKVKYFRSIFKHSEVADYLGGVYRISVIEDIDYGGRLAVQLIGDSGIFWVSHDDIMVV